MNKNRQSNKRNLASQIFQRLIKISKESKSKSMITLLALKPGEELYRVGKNARQVFYLATGLIKLVRPQETGYDSLVHLSSDREFLGILSLVRGYQYTATGIAISNAEVYRINRDFFINTVDTDSKLAPLFLQYLLESVYTAETRINELITKNVEERIAAALLTLYKI